jgi:hypothetical protein
MLAMKNLVRILPFIALSLMSCGKKSSHKMTAVEFQSANVDENAMQKANLNFAEVQDQNKHKDWEVQYDEPKSEEDFNKKIEALTLYYGIVSGAISTPRLSPSSLDTLTKKKAAVVEAQNNLQVLKANFLADLARQEAEKQAAIAKRDRDEAKEKEAKRVADESIRKLREKQMDELNKEAWQKDHGGYIPIQDFFSSELFVEDKEAYYNSRLPLDKDAEFDSKRAEEIDRTQARLLEALSLRIKWLEEQVKFMEEGADQLGLLVPTPEKERAEIIAGLKNGLERNKIMRENFVKAMNFRASDSMDPNFKQDPLPPATSENAAAAK